MQFFFSFSIFLLGSFFPTASVLWLPFVSSAAPQCCYCTPSRVPFSQFAVYVIFSVPLIPLFVSSHTVPKAARFVDLLSICPPHCRVIGSLRSIAQSRAFLFSCRRCLLSSFYPFLAACCHCSEWTYTGANRTTGAICVRWLTTPPTNFANF